MSHYDVNYAELSGDAKRAKAIADIIDYVGAERFASLHFAFLAGKKPSLDGFGLQLSFAGIQGYPVTAWYEMLWGTQVSGNGYAEDRG